VNKIFIRNYKLLLTFNCFKLKKETGQYFGIIHASFEAINIIIGDFTKNRSVWTKIFLHQGSLENEDNIGSSTMKIILQNQLFSLFSPPPQKKIFFFFFPKGGGKIPPPFFFI